MRAPPPGSLDALLGGVALPGPTSGTQLPRISPVHGTLHRKSLGIWQGSDSSTLASTPESREDYTVNLRGLPPVAPFLDARAESCPIPALPGSAFTTLSGQKAKDKLLPLFLISPFQKPTALGTHTRRNSSGAVPVWACSVSGQVLIESKEKGKERKKKKSFVLCCLLPC